MNKECTHLDLIKDVTPNSKGCEDCIKMGDSLIQSPEPGENWIWCYADEVVWE